MCTSVQRLYVHDRVADKLLDGVLGDLAQRKVGDPSDADTFVGPLISVSEAERVERWVAGAVDRGAELLTGGRRERGVVQPAVLRGVQQDMDVMCREVFGPVISVITYSDLDDAVREINATPYGLSAGIFTTDVARGLRTAEQLRMGSVHINETSSSRVDLMPYGGVKQSGFGKEGPKYAMRELTEERLVTITLP